MNKILIVEDEIVVALDLKIGLENLGYVITACVDSLSSACTNIRYNKPDLVFMDINLNTEENGIDIAKKIYNRYSIPIIFLTAYHDDETIKKVVRLKPMGYLNKPFNLNDLKTTIELAFYKIKEINNLVNKNYFNLYGNYFFDLTNELLYYNRTIIKLSKREKKLLKLLIEAKGNIVTFETIEYLLWDNSMSSSALRTLLYRLRNKLKRNIVETIPSVGCKINL